MREMRSDRTVVDYRGRAPVSSRQITDDCLPCRSSARRTQERRNRPACSALDRGGLAQVGGKEAGSMIVVPISLREANDFVSNFHRHNGRTSRDGGKFAIGASDGDRMFGVAIVGRPIARLLARDHATGEVLRCCVTDDAPKGTCSFLYSRCWRAWQAMGGRKLITYTLESETGSSLRGAGWRIVGQVKPGGWDRESLGRAREWKPIYGQQKLRWEVSMDAQ